MKFAFVILLPASRKKASGRGRRRCSHGGGALSGAARQRTGCALLIFISALSGLVKIRARPQQLLPVSASGRGRRRCPKGGVKNRPTATRAQPQRAGARKPVPKACANKKLGPHECVGRVKSFSVPFFKKEQNPAPVTPSSPHGKAAVRRLRSPRR